MPKATISSIDAPDRLDPLAPPPVAPIEIAAFRSEGSAHRPRTGLRLGYNSAGLYAWFTVDDRWVRCVHSGWQAPVWRDSCVELFLQPQAGGGYFNFEFNAGGAMLAGFVTDHRRHPDGTLNACTPLTPAQCAQIGVATSLPPRVEPEVGRPLSWHLACHIPFALLETFTGRLTIEPGRRWRGNFYKCGDDTSHPHWAAWAPVDALNFHLPHCFGELQFS